jgi:hypothetical protein
MKKIIANAIALVLACLLSGCIRTSSVADELPHSNLIGFWRLKTDCYIVENVNDSHECSLVPCVAEMYLDMPNGNCSFDVKRLGEFDGAMLIVACIGAGNFLYIEGVNKTESYSFGPRFTPVVSFNNIRIYREAKAHLYYYGFEDKGILNPELAERVSMPPNTATNELTADGIHNAETNN